MHSSMVMFVCVCVFVASVSVEGVSGVATVTRGVRRSVE